ncbi:putative unusual protein kinase regulating ubiquinone biosynthesis (AarF/ABC1/UbiB family) [Litorivivens lipolytica]|uniref:Putative unusual protein kinase regulating ubiquinone biosynthesis (AarF/ABC1/UbiB family) n=1 Tax=Litorivivens lipolytica TaxID=1524264 RepID=A0A7W4Z690_9GAMM|nr:AarF/ABC1/UbiB kinase family protein [Litorivivens lipolytica]MBB3048274.1 putative unusual protein kinase regulating ubiquinone biosynthesis (AarF/ABC1/UbiB family) [Litorivivens lipolytica]
MSDDSKTPPDTLKRLKTSALSRRWQLSRASMQYGRRAMGSAIRSRLGASEESQQAARQANIDAFVQELGKLKGSIVKIGQIMATYGDYLMPPEVVTALHRLEDNTPPMHWSAIEKQLKKELGEARLADLDIETEAVAAASLGQVHRATLLSTGESVCLKIQYPGVDQTIDADFNDLIRLFKVSRVLESTRSVDEWFSDIRNLLRREVDYTNERAELEFARGHLDGDSRFIVPAVYGDYCSQRVLCMSWEEGVSIKHPDVAALPQGTRNELGEAILELFLIELYDWQRMQTDPNFGNYRVRLNGEQAQLVLLDFGAIRPLPDAFVADFQRMIHAAYRSDKVDFLDASIKLGFMKPHFPESVLENFAEIGIDILEPLRPRSDSIPESALTDGQYDWQQSQLPKRIAKRALAASISKYFALPPKEFLYVMRKLMGVYALIAALRGQFFADHLLARRVNEQKTSSPQ